MMVQVISERGGVFESFGWSAFGSTIDAKPR